MQKCIVDVGHKEELPSSHAGAGSLPSTLFVGLLYLVHPFNCQLSGHTQKSRYNFRIDWHWLAIPGLGQGSARNSVTINKLV